MNDFKLGKTRVKITNKTCIAKINGKMKMSACM